MSFNPDVFLAKTNPKKGFDPDAFLAKTQTQKPAFIPAHTPVTSEDIQNANAWGQGVSRGMNTNTTPEERNKVYQDSGTPTNPVSQIGEGLRRYFASRPGSPMGANLLNYGGEVLEAPFFIPSQLTKGVLGEKGAELVNKPVQYLGTGFENLLPQTPMGKAGARVLTDLSLYTLPKITEGTGFRKMLGKLPETMKENRTGTQLSKATKEMKRVAPPGRKELNYDQANGIWQQYMNRALKTDPNAIDRTDVGHAVRQVTDLTADQMKELWSDLDKANKQFGDAKIIDGKTVKSEVLKNAQSNQYAATMKPEQITATKSFADNLPDQMSPSEAAAFIKGLNADLSNYYKKTPTEQAVIENKYGGTAGLKAVRDALANEYFDKLESFGQKGIPKARRDYGALSQMHTALERNITRAEKPANPLELHRTGPALLGEIAGNAVGGPLGGPAGMAIGYGLGKYLKNRYAPNATVLRVLGRIAKYGSEPSDIPGFDPNIKGYLPPGTPELPPPQGSDKMTVTTGPSGMEQTPERRALPPGPVITPPPADASKITVKTGLSGMEQVPEKSENVLEASTGDYPVVKRGEQAPRPESAPRPEETLPNYVQEHMTPPAPDEGEVPKLLVQRAKALGLRVDKPQYLKGKVYSYSFTPPSGHSIVIKPSESLDAAYNRKVNELKAQGKDINKGESNTTTPKPAETPKESLIEQENQSILNDTQKKALQAEYDKLRAANLKMDSTPKKNANPKALQRMEEIRNLAARHHQAIRQAEQDKAMQTTRELLQKHGINEGDEIKDTGTYSVPVSGKITIGKDGDIYVDRIPYRPTETIVQTLKKYITQIKGKQ